VEAWTGGSSLSRLSTAVLRISHGLGSRRRVQRLHLGRRARTMGNGSLDANLEERDGETARDSADDARLSAHGGRNWMCGSRRSVWARISG